MTVVFVPWLWWCWPGVWWGGGRSHFLIHAKVQKGLVLVPSGKEWKVETDPVFVRKPCSFSTPEVMGGFCGRCYVWVSVVGRNSGHYVRGEKSRKEQWRKSRQ